MTATRHVAFSLSAILRAQLQVCDEWQQRSVHAHAQGSMLASILVPARKLLVHTSRTA